MKRNLKPQNIEALCLVLACGWLAGCGGSGVEPLDVHPVSGTVTLGGEPLADAQVTLISDEGGRVAVGTTGADGKFTVTTKGQPGAVAGSHKATVVAVQGETGPPPEEGSEEYARMMAGEMPESESPIPDKYADVNTSGLTATVEPGGSEITFELTK